MRKQFVKTLILGTLAVGAALVTGCFTSTNSDAKDATLSIQMGVKDVNKDALSKGSTIAYTKLVVTMISNATVPDTLRDTIFTGQNGFGASSTDSQTVAKTYNVKPLRSWTVQVKTLDQNDSIIHSASTSANNVLVGETRAITLNLTSRFVMYVAKFVLPDSLSANGTSIKQKLNINRFMMVVDGDTVVDSTKASGYFHAGAPAHSVQFDYIKADTTHSLELYIFGVIPGWPANKPLFGDTIVVSAGSDTTYKPTLPWMGPGSKNDPDYDSTNGGGAKAGLTINIGKVGTVFFEPQIDSTLFKARNKQ